MLRRAHDKLLLDEILKSRKKKEVKKPKKYKIKNRSYHTGNFNDLFK